MPVYFNNTLINNWSCKVLAINNDQCIMFWRPSIALQNNNYYESDNHGHLATMYYVMYIMFSLWSGMQTDYGVLVLLIIILLIIIIITIVGMTAILLYWYIYRNFTSVLYAAIAEYVGISSTSSCSIVSLPVSLLQKSGSVWYVIIIVIIISILL